MNKLQKKMFAELLFWSGEKKEGENSSILNKFAISLATFFLCNITRDQYSGKRNVTYCYETLADIGMAFADFANWESDAPPQRIHEALESLESIGFLDVDKDDSNREMKDKYHFRDKVIFLVTINLETFAPEA
ncbi:hypothetical protein J3369_16080 [Alteromonas sp. NFXS44]|uniref:hypothetical protein n=1 Tax=Alteromonas sp. NFXS44 TaxID=2818435 RepID=UPI0032DFC23C